MPNPFVSETPSVPESIFESAILIDTSALYALADPRDANHQEAVSCLELIAQYGLPIWVTSYTIAETHARILQGLGVNAGLTFLTNIYDGGLTVERPYESDEQRAVGYVNKFSSLTLSLFDALSFSVMTRLGIGKAFSFDAHFRILGFVLVPPFYI